MGASQRRKGVRGELEFAHEVGGRRVPLSGAAQGYSNDVTFTISHDHPEDIEYSEPTELRAEVKRRKGGWIDLYRWLSGNENEEAPDVLAIRADRMPWLVVMTVEKFRELTGIPDPVEVEADVG